MTTTVPPTFTGPKLVGGRSAYELAHMADVASPDNDDSPGAEWLRLVAGDLHDLLDQYATEVMAGEIDPETDLGDEITESADQIVPTYTHHRWQVFIDLAAYQEDVSELGEIDGDDLTRSVAGVALYMIAERLMNALIAEIDTDEDDDSNENE